MQSLRVLAAAVLTWLFLAPACAGSNPGEDPGASPDEAFDTYRALLQARALSEDSRVLTTDSRGLLSRGYSGSQQSREAEALSRVQAGRLTRTQGDRAVVWFPGSDEVSPYFLRRGDEGWQVDLASMAENIGFDREDHWFFRSTDHPYSFAFE